MPRVLQISDSHIVEPGALAYGVVDTAAALAAAVATVNRALERIGPIDLALVTGDLTDRGAPAEYSQFIAVMEQLRLDYVAIPGNHDDREAMRAAFAGRTWMPTSGAICWRVDLKGLAVLGLDSLVSGQAEGGLGADMRAWLDRELTALAPLPVIIALHHPPIATGLALMDQQGLRDAPALASLVNAYPGPCLIVAGHAHRMLFGSLGRAPVAVCPGASHAVTFDLRTARNNSFHLEPGGVLIHELGPAFAGPGFVGPGFRTHLLPIGAFDGPYPFL